jgi:hypothetical protein
MLKSYTPSVCEASFAVGWWASAWRLEFLGCLADRDKGECTDQRDAARVVFKGDGWPAGRWRGSVRRPGFRPGRLFAHHPLASVEWDAVWLGPVTHWKPRRRRPDRRPPASSCGLPGDSGGYSGSGMRTGMTPRMRFSMASGIRPNRVGQSSTTYSSPSSPRPRSPPASSPTGKRWWPISSLYSLKRSASPSARRGSRSKGSRARVMPAPPCSATSAPNSRRKPSAAA